MKAPFEEYSLFSPQERLEIINRYLPQYEIIAKKYLKRTDGKLFYEPLPDPGEPWKSYEGLTVEKIVPVYLQMMYTMERTLPEKEYHGGSARHIYKLDPGLVKNTVRFPEAIEFFIHETRSLPESFIFSINITGFDPVSLLPSPRHRPGPRRYP